MTARGLTRSGYAALVGASRQGGGGTRMAIGGATGRRMPWWAPIAVLLVGQFAPYGMFSAGAGTLRPDHVIIPAVFVVGVAVRRVRFSGPLAAGLLAFAGFAVLSTLFNWDLVGPSPTTALKNLDGMLRGPFVLAIASSATCDARFRQRLGIALAAIAVAYAAMAAAELLLPTSDSIVEAIVTGYGGPAYTEGLYGDMGVNHKQLMIQAGRASAVFVTAPALGMASAVLLLVASMPHTGSSARMRWTLAIFAAAGGLLSNSKSFLFSLPILAGLLLARRGFNVRSVVLLAFATAVLAGAILVGMDGDEPVLAVNAMLQGDGNRVFALTGGRLGGSEWTALDVLLAVLHESPFLGFGLGQVPHLVYSDSAVNRAVLHAGVIGVVVLVWAIAAQWFRFGQGGRTGWSRVGRELLVLCVGFFAAGAVFMMPRINDLIFTVLGTAIASRQNGARAIQALDGTRPKPVV